MALSASFMGSCASYPAFLGVMDNSEITIPIISSTCSVRQINII